MEIKTVLSFCKSSRLYKVTPLRVHANLILHNEWGMLIYIGRNGNNNKLGFNLIQLSSVVFSFFWQTLSLLYREKREEKVRT